MAPPSPTGHSWCRKKTARACRTCRRRRARSSAARERAFLGGRLVASTAQPTPGVPGLGSKLMAKHSRLKGRDDPADPAILGAPLVFGRAGARPGSCGPAWPWLMARRPRSRPWRNSRRCPRRARPRARAADVIRGSGPPPGWRPPKMVPTRRHSDALPSRVPRSRGRVAAMADPLKDIMVQHFGMRTDKRGASMMTRHGPALCRASTS